MQTETVVWARFGLGSPSNKGPDELVRDKVERCAQTTSGSLIPCEVVTEAEGPIFEAPVGCGPGQAACCIEGRCAGGLDQDETLVRMNWLSRLTHSSGP